jgi:hypothetical protein
MRLKQTFGVEDAGQVTRDHLDHHRDPVHVRLRLQEVCIVVLRLAHSLKQVTNLG